jgi:multidrug efflux pump subunit AcrA (membrane-fusion protein)
MKNQDEKIKPNMLATLRLKDYSAEDVIVIPTQLIRQDVEGYFVFVSRPHDGEYFGMKTYITPGRSDGKRTVVEEGLKPGDALIVKGYNQIKDGSTLSITQK